MKTVQIFNLELVFFLIQNCFVFFLPQDKKKVACRHDWHQTGNNVVVTIYAKNANPESSRIEANSTVVSERNVVT